MQNRGTDSTGIAAFDNGGVNIFKRAVNAGEFVKTHSFFNLTRKKGFVIGHTRLATTGVVSDRNSHPFIKDNIVGAHNGVVHNWRTVKEVDEDIEVDSEIIFSQLAKSKNNPVDAFKEITGSFSITWADTETPNILFVARKTNPFYFLHVDEIKTMFWCSEIYALQAVVGAVFDQMGTLYEIDEEETHVFDEENRLVQKIKSPFKTYAAVTYNNNYNGYGRDHDYSHVQDASPWEKEVGKKKEKKEKKEIKNEQNSLLDLSTLVGERCALCGLAINKALESYWIDKKSLSERYCLECIDTDLWAGSDLVYIPRGKPGSLEDLVH